MEEKEYGVCEVTAETKEIGASKYGPYTVGVVYFSKTYSAKPHIQLTASQENRPSEWVDLSCTILELTETYLVIDFDGWLRKEDGTLDYRQEVWPGAKCYWLAYPPPTTALQGG